MAVREDGEESEAEEDEVAEPAAFAEPVAEEEQKRDQGFGVEVIFVEEELEIAGEKNFYFLGPRAGGTEILHDRKEILVITPQSPLGEQLMGKKSGEQPQLNFGGAKQAAKILKVE